LLAALPGLAQTGTGSGTSSSFSGSSFSGGMNSFSGGSGGSSSGGGGFTGSSSSGSFTGSSGGFTGSSSSGSFTGSSGGSFIGSNSSSGRGASSYGSSSLFGPNSVNPYTKGSPLTNYAQSFGKPLYTYGTGTGFGSSGGFNSGGLSGGTVSGGSTGLNQGRNSVFVSTVGLTYAAPTLVTVPPSPTTTPPTAAAAQLQGELQQMLARSTRLSNPSAVAVAMDGSTVVLRGTVANDAEKRLTEGMVRLTPGVREVLNEIKVQPP